MKDKLLDLLSAGETEEVIQLMLREVKNTKLRQEVIHLSARFNNLKNEINRDTISLEKYELGLNKINASLLLLINKSDTNDAISAGAFLRPSRKKIWLILGATIILIGTVIWFLTKPEVVSDTLTLTVYVIGEKGQKERPLDNKGSVLLHHEYDQVAKINDKGEANFNNIPSLFRNHPISINIKEEPNVTYEAIWPDSQYVIGNSKSVLLKVRTKGLDKISGKIRDANTNEPIAGVKVLVAKGVFVLTDVDGLFELTIPGEHQRRELPLTLSKDGYQIADITATPETGAPVNFQMKRK